MEVADIYKLLLDQTYIGDRSIATSILLSIKLEKPLLIEGPAGVGKTEIAKVLAQAMDAELIRLQCYEGLDASHAIYEWNYQHQLLHLKMLEDTSDIASVFSPDVFSLQVLAGNLQLPLFAAWGASFVVLALLANVLARKLAGFDKFMLNWHLSNILFFHW